MNNDEQIIIDNLENLHKLKDSLRTGDAFVINGFPYFVQHKDPETGRIEIEFDFPNLTRSMWPKGDYEDE
jgi:hypothetical protein